MNNLFNFLKPKDQYLKNEIQFNPTTHQYIVNNELWPMSVTQSDQTFSWFFKKKVNPIILEKAINRGVQMHKAVELLISKKFNFEEFIKNSPTIVSKPTIEKIRNLEKKLLNLFEKMNMEPIATELTIADTTLRMVGTVDLICRDKTKNSIYIFDLKSSKMPPEQMFFLRQAPQMFKYEHLLRQNFDVEKMDVELIIFYANEDGLTFKKIGKDSKILHHEN